MKKIIACVMLSCVLGGAAVNAHAADNFRSMVVEENGVNNIKYSLEDYYPREQWEKDTITYENKEKGYLCVGRNGKLCYSYKNNEERSEILNDLYEGEQE